jgi:hypothetical protein
VCVCVCVCVWVWRPRWSVVILVCFKLPKYFSPSFSFSHTPVTWLNPLYPAMRRKVSHAMPMHSKLFIWRPNLAYCYLNFPFFSTERCKLTFSPCTSYCYYDWQNKECKESVIHRKFQYYGYALFRVIACLSILLIKKNLNHIHVSAPHSQ